MIERRKTLHGVVLRLSDDGTVVVGAHAEYLTVMVENGVVIPGSGILDTVPLALSTDLEPITGQLLLVQQSTIEVLSEQVMEQQLHIQELEALLSTQNTESSPEVSSEE